MENKTMNELQMIIEQNDRGIPMIPSETYTISLARFGDVVLFDIKGDMTAFSEPFFKDAYTQAVQQTAEKIIFNFQSNAYINSAGIAIFIQVLAQAVNNGLAIEITGLSRHFTKIFNMLGITKFAKIHDSAVTAATAFLA